MKTNEGNFTIQIGSKTSEDHKTCSLFKAYQRKYLYVVIIAVKLY
jgi:hypothetical protein